MPDSEEGCIFRDFITPPGVPHVVSNATAWANKAADPTESNPADIPSRLHEMSAEQAADALRDLGEPIEMVLPAFADDAGEWLSSKAIAESVYHTT